MEVFHRGNWKPMTSTSSSSVSSNVVLKNPMNLTIGSSCIVATPETLQITQRDGCMHRDMGPLMLSIEWYYSLADRISLLNWIIVDVNKVGPHIWIERQLNAFENPVWLVYPLLSK